MFASILVGAPLGFAAAILRCFGRLAGLIDLEHNRMSEDEYKAAYYPARPFFPLIDWSRPPEPEDDVIR